MKTDINNEYLILSYLFRNLRDIKTFEEGWFLEPQNRFIFQALRKLEEDGLKFSFDTIISNLQEITTKEIPYNFLVEIFEQYTDFSNIEFHKRLLKNDYLKQIETRKILENLLTKTTTKGYIDPDALRKEAKELIRIIDDLDEKKGVFDTDDLKNIYLQELERRSQGEVQRSLGFSLLNKLITRPAAPGEMTTIFGESGSGKSIFLKSIENILFNMGVPVLSFNTEMSTISSLDRFMCIRANVPLEELLKQEMNPRIRVKVKNAIESFSSKKNYLYVDSPSLTFDDIEREIYKAQEYFYKQGILGSDGYIFVTIDLLSMVKEFDDMDPRTIEKCMNTLNSILKRTNVHAMNAVQAGESKFRTGKSFRKPEDLDFIKIGLEDVKNGSAYKERSRVMIALQRPLHMKERFFPEMKHIWELEPDIIKVHILKQNDGKLGFGRLVMQNNFRICAYEEDSASG